MYDKEVKKGTYYFRTLITNVKEAVLEYIYQKAFHISHHLQLTWLNLNQVNFQNTSSTQKQKQVVEIKWIACKIVNNNNDNV